MICREDFIQNLKDAGCNECLIQKLAETSDKKQLQLLSKHRQELLKSLHKYQKEIDCLDFLVYKMKKEGISL